MPFSAFALLRCTTFMRPPRTIYDAPHLEFRSHGRDTNLLGRARNRRGTARSRQPVIHLAERKKAPPKPTPQPKEDIDALLKKANEPGVQAMKLHPFYQGKIEVSLKPPVRSFDDFAIWYTPGVAKPCLEIAKRPEAVYEMTNKWNNVAIVTDGTRVLGLGDIGPEAGLPVMEGKSLLFKFLGGVDAYPICLGTKNPEEIIQAVKWLQPSFGGVNLEDIAQPKCFTILRRLREECHIPVWHDDQQGTATVVTAGLMNALRP